MTSPRRDATMPPVSDPRQADTPLGWFTTLAGQGVLAAEESAAIQALEGGPDLPWLWLGVPGIAPPARRRQPLVLHRDGDGWRGDVHCDLRLPVARDAVGAIMLQHALDADGDLRTVLGECERVLVPGGTLWIATLNPWTPYRARWLGTGLDARDPGQWQRALARSGFATDAIRVQWLGPYWRGGHGEAGVGVVDRVRAAFAITVIKRVAAPIARVRARQWSLRPAHGALPRSHARR